MAPRLTECPLSVFAAALTLDLAFGEPPYWMHPVVGIGRLARWLIPTQSAAIGEDALTPGPTPGSGRGGHSVTGLEDVGSVEQHRSEHASLVTQRPPLPDSGVGPGVRARHRPEARARRTPSTATPAGLGQFLYGAVASALTVSVAAFVAAGAERLPLPRPLAFLLRAWLLKTTFSVRALLAAGEAVRRPLAARDVDAARLALRSLVSRETDALGPGLIAAAAVESLAENATDSALAPWLAYAVGGLPAAAAYRALNTLDSMIGYRGRYEYLGKAAARADDAANWLPARLGAILIAVAAPAGPGDAAGALAAARRDHGRTASPNAGWTMAAMAGALGRTLEKHGHYRLGAGPEPSAADIRRAQRIAAAVLAMGAVMSATLVALSGRGRGGSDAAARGQAR